MCYVTDKGMCQQIRGRLHLPMRARINSDTMCCIVPLEYKARPHEFSGNNLYTKIIAANWYSLVFPLPRIGYLEEAELVA